jgi:N-acetylglucosamine-6-sulfatase
MELGRRAFLQGVAGVGVCAMADGVEAPREPLQRRNIVLILVDDMRFDAMGWMGHPFLETPHLDQLAAGGAAFSRAYVTTALCSPSRASILTGTYAHRHGVLDNQTALPADLATFPALLQGAGYRTGFVGKWHMGGDTDARQPGFDRWVSFRGQGVYENPELRVDDGERAKVEGYTTDLLTEHAVEFIGGQAGQPFCLFLSHKAVHAEFVPAARHAGSYAEQTYPHPASMADTDASYAGKPAWVRAQRASWHGVDGMYDKKVAFDAFARQYAETMRAVDDSVGSVVGRLRELGLLESTLLLFTSDNGFLFGEHGLIDKRCMYEPSIRVPLIAHCPELIAAGMRPDALVANIDLAPTLLEVCGVDVPGSMQGRSWLPLLQGCPLPDRECILYEYFWERSFPQTPTVLGVHTGRYKLMQYHGIWDKYELYDLEQDPDEQHNLVGAQLQTSQAGALEGLIRRDAPPETSALFSRMLKLLHDTLASTGCRAEPKW